MDMQLDLFQSQPAASNVWTVEIYGNTVSYTLKKSPRARHVWLKVGIGTGLEVVAPARMPLKELDAILAKKASWIEKHLPNPGLTHKLVKRPVLKDGVKVYYLGEEHPVRVRVNHRGSPVVRLLSGEIVAEMPDSRTEPLKDAIEAWYKKMARQVIMDKVEKLSNGKRFGRISIRDQKTRWGSCSSKGNLSFNWRLIMAPPKVIEYLVVHELTHREHPNHSKRFWAKVEKRCPGYQEREAWLKENGRGLVLI
ncbi:MAG: SprT family zinc-dependent metalloprotease [Nitrospirota bacterium]